MSKRIGKPQFIAAGLLLIFLAQCTWLVGHSLRGGQLELRERYRIDTGFRLMGAKPLTASEATDPRGDAGPAAPDRIREHEDIDPDHSALWYLIAAAPLRLWTGALTSESLSMWAWLARAPYLFFGVMLGASLWYVARRLYGNAGGFIALTLYCFSPGIIRTTAGWFAEPEIGAAWGAFGAIFTGIAVAHTLYAPREVVLWNWRRILLLGVSIALAVGSQYSLFVLVLLAFGFMLYLAPTRRGAALLIWVAACVIALVLVFASYGFRVPAFGEALRHAEWLGLTGQALGSSGSLRRVLTQLGIGSPAIVMMLPIALLVYAAWPRARYFGNTAPLLVATICLFLSWASPHYPGLGYQLVAVPFVFVFVAGVFADLLETRQRVLVLASVFGLLSAYALLSLMRLAEASMQ
jgi:hypothetical protein